MVYVEANDTELPVPGLKRSHSSLNIFYLFIYLDIHIVSG